MEVDTLLDVSISVLISSLSLPSLSLPLFLSLSAPPPRGLQTPNHNGGPPLPPRPSQGRRVSESPNPRIGKVPRESTVYVHCMFMRVSSTCTMSDIHVCS